MSVSIAGAYRPSPVTTTGTTQPVSGADDRLFREYSKDFQTVSDASESQSSFLDKLHRLDDKFSRIIYTQHFKDIDPCHVFRQMTTQVPATTVHPKPCVAAALPSSTLRLQQGSPSPMGRGQTKSTGNAVADAAIDALRERHHSILNHMTRDRH